MDMEDLRRWLAWGSHKCLVPVFIATEVARTMCMSGCSRDRYCLVSVFVATKVACTEANGSSSSLKEAYEAAFTVAYAAGLVMDAVRPLRVRFHCPALR